AKKSFVRARRNWPISTRPTDRIFHDLEAFRHQRQDGAGNRRIARHRLDDRARFRGERSEGLHLLAQGGCLRARGGGAFKIRHLHSRGARSGEDGRSAGAAWAEPLEKYSEEGWDKLMNVNLKAIFFLTQGLLPLLKAAASKDDPAR